MSKAISIRPGEDRSFFGLDFPNQIFDQMKSIHDEIERAAFGLFQQRTGNDGTSLEDWFQAESSLLQPVPISIKDDKDHLTVTADVPGFSINELKVHVDGQELQVCGKSESASKTDKESSSTSRRVCCSVMLPTSVRPDDASATLDKGVLTLKLPKAQPAKEIEIKAAA